MLCPRVASFTDAWIETPDTPEPPHQFAVASFTDAWIETEKGRQTATPTRRRIFYRCVDWNERQEDWELEI